MTVRHPLLPADVTGCGESAGCQRAESEFLAAISHEFRTPIHGVIGLAELLAGGPLPPAEREYVRMIDQCARSLLALVDHALEVSHTEAGRLRLGDAEIDLQQLLRELARDAALQAEDKGIAFELATDAAVPAWVLADAGRLQQVLCKLLGNALKFTASGSIVLDVHVRLLPAGERLVFAVHDTGVGIAPSEQAPPVRPFRSARQRRPSASIRVRASASRPRANSRGAWAAISSSPAGPAKALSFSLVLPLRQHAPERQVSAAVVPPTDARILLVEDNAVNQVVARGLLANLGHTRVTLAGDGLQALEACAREPFDLVLMDCQMPGMDGLRATALLRERGVATPILALTASPVIGDRDRCLAAGMDDYLTKPIDPALLARKLAQWLRGPQQAALQAQAQAERVVPAAAQRVPTGSQAKAKAGASFDEHVVQERFCGDAGLFAECRRIFLCQTPARLAQAADCIAAGDAQQVRFLAHTLRGSAATVGAPRLALCCRLLEQCLEPAAPNLAAAATHLAAARTEFAAFADASAAHAMN